MNQITSETDLLLLGNLYVVSRALHVVAEQKIADHFEDDLPLSIDALSQKAEIPPVALAKLLRVLSPFGVFKEHENGAFSLEKVGEALKSHHPSGMRDLLFCEEGRWNSFGKMSDSLKSGETGFSLLYQEEYFDYLERHPRLQADFDRHMQAVSLLEDPMVANSLPLEGKERVVDVGGGKGGLIQAVLEAHPKISGGIFDLPGVAGDDLQRLSQQYKGRFELFFGSFFESLPFQRDAIILKRVLHDWNDADSIRILTHCRDALKDNASEIYIVESILTGKGDPTLPRIFDLLLLTVFGGIERTKEDYEGLLGQSGLRLKEVLPTQSEMSILVVGK